MHENTNRGECKLETYGIRHDAVHAIFGNIVEWLEGKNLKWKQTNYLHVFLGPKSRVAAEILFFHYDGPPEREIGSGGERNVCRMYLYDDHCTISFIGDDEDSVCGINFRYSTNWVETDHRLLHFLRSYVNSRMENVFTHDPSRFKGMDFEIEYLRKIVGIIEEAIDGQLV